jgi:lysyl-tRNA synthetase class 2
MYLRISNELYLKRLIIGGLNQVFEFAKDFRNEGIDTTHNPEFTQLEAYQAYSDYNDMMNLVESLVSRAATAVTGSTSVNYQGTQINLEKPWKRISMEDAVKQHSKVDWKNCNRQ